MRRAIIVHNCDNDSLLRLTQTKLFYDAKNQGLEYFSDCITVKNYNEAYKIAKDNDLVLQTGDFITTSYRGIHRNEKYVHNIEWCESRKGHEECVIKFDQDKPIDYKKRRYEQGSKQNYIIENILKTVIISKKMLYLENTEDPEIRFRGCRLYPGPAENFNYIEKLKDMKHFYGLASGWKSMIHAVQNDYESVTVFDKNQKQLDFTKKLHSLPVLPDTIEEKHGKEVAIYGEYVPTEFVKDNWSKWHELDVKFELINLFELPRFKPNSVVWASNVFHYEATLFEYGYDYVKNKLEELTELNSDCIILSN